MIGLSAPRDRVKGLIKLSGSKSISNRLLILSEVLECAPDFRNLSDSKDTRLLQKALKQINSAGKSVTMIDVQDAGTDMRFLTALLSVTEGEWIITGSERMKQRPVGELVNALIQLGADIHYEGKEGFPPLRIKGKKLAGGTIGINTSISSQFISALLLVAPSFQRGLTLLLKGNTVSRPYINMTSELLKGFGINVDQSSHAIQVFPSPAFRLPVTVQIESDWSSASYWYCICALAHQAEIELAYFNEKSLQADSVLPELFKNLGVKSVFREKSVLLTSIKPIATEFKYDFTHCPDIAQTIAVTCFGLGIKAELSGLNTLRIKETDRISALKTELEKLNAQVMVTEDKMIIERPGTKNKKQGALINTYNDHRMAMSFAPLVLLYDRIEIDDHEVIDKSYPAFWEDLKSMGFNVNLQP